MITKKTVRLGVLFILLVLTMSACATAPSVPVPSIPTQLKVAYLGAAKSYESLVKKETDITALYQKWEENRSNWMAGAGDQKAGVVVDECYAKTTDAVTQMAAGVFGKDAQGNPVNADAENKAFINALGTGGSLYAGNLDRCQQAALDLASYIRANREKDAGTRNMWLDMIRSYDLDQVKTPDIAVVLHFYNQYGPEVAQMVQKGEQQLLDKLAAENGLKALPYSFIGFPTAALKVLTKSKEICQGYNEVYTGKTPPPGDYNKLLFQTDYDSVVGSCTLYRRAAYNYMNRLFVTTTAAQQFDTSTDTGVFGQPTPKPAPTLGK